MNNTIPKVILLIVSSNDIPAYKTMKNIISLYCDKFKESHGLNYFFTELTEEINDEIVYDICNNTVYIKGKECVTPGVAIKTYKTIGFINKNYTYDYFVRTNLSSFYNLNILYELLEEYYKNKKEKLAIGFLPFDTFISGTSLILSKDIVDDLYKHVNIQSHAILNNNEDVYFSKIIKNITQIKALPINKNIYHLIDTKYIIPEDISEILYFRVKSDDRNHDANQFIKLAKKIYNIDYKNN